MLQVYAYGIALLDSSSVFAGQCPPTVEGRLAW
jgi:hypothetical protein